MRRKLLFLMLFVGLLCLPVTGFGATNLVVNPGFEIDENDDGEPDGWTIWTSSNPTWGGPDQTFVNDPLEARTGDWCVKLLGGAWGSAAGFGGSAEHRTPIKLGGTYYVGGYAKDLKPGNNPSPDYPDSEVLYFNAAGDRVGDERPNGDVPGDPVRHGLFLPIGDPGTPTNPDFLNTPFPRDDEYHMYYGFTKPLSVLNGIYDNPGPVTSLAAGCWSHNLSYYIFDDMWTGDALQGALVWGLDPEDDEKGISPNQTILSWGRQKVCSGEKAIPCEIWWGEIDDPNFWQQNPIKIMEMTDTNFLDLSTIPAPLGGPIVLQPEENYYWKIIYEEPNECFFGKRAEADTWHFDTINDPPVVDAGLHYDIWQNLAGDPIVIGIDASYSDDGNPEGWPVSHKWAASAGVVYLQSNDGGTTSDVQDPNISIAAVGDYELTLTVHDGVGDIQDKTGTDTILIRVIANGDSRLRAHYELNGNIIDSAEAHSASIVDNPTWGVGQVGGAIELDGSDDDADGRSDQVEIDDTGSDPNFQSDTWENSDLIDGMTVSAWMKLDADGWSTTWEGIVTKHTTGWELMRAGSSNNVTFGIKQIGGAGSGASNPVVDDDPGWHQVVGVYDRNTIKLYVDGLEAGSSDADTLDLEAESNFDKDGQPINDKEWQMPKTIGKILIGSTSWNGAFGGLLDQVRIFDAAVPWWAQHAGTPGIVEMYRADGGHISCGGQYVSSDIDEDCFVTLADAALLALNWVECTNVADAGCDLAHHEE